MTQLLVLPDEVPLRVIETLSHSLFADFYENVTLASTQRTKKTVPQDENCKRRFGLTSLLD